jgi:DNA polymerase III epsilon subunit-like protein
MSIVFFDTETAGLRHDHPTIQIAAIAVDPASEWQEVEVFEVKLKFDVGVADPEALLMNHYNAETWAREAVLESEAVAKFKAFLERHRSIHMIGKGGKPYTVCRVGGHNIAGFDLDRVSRMFRKHGQFLPVKYSAVLDTLHGTSWHFGLTASDKCPPDLKLLTLGRWFKLNVLTGDEEKKAHEALFDVRLSIELAKFLLGADR